MSWHTERDDTVLLTGELEMHRVVALVAIEDAEAISSKAEAGIVGNPVLVCTKLTGFFLVDDFSRIRHFIAS